MNAQPQDLKEQLLRTDEEFHDLSAKHHELEDRLHELTSKHYLSEPEQLEEVTLKKRKLQLKDRMEDILRRHRQGSTRTGNPFACVAGAPLACARRSRSQPPDAPRSRRPAVHRRRAARRR